MINSSMIRIQHLHRVRVAYYTLPMQKWVQTYIFSNSLQTWVCVSNSKALLKFCPVTVRFLRVVRCCPSALNYEVHNRKRHCMKLANG